MGCVSCPRGWVREGCVRPPVRSLEVEPFLITKLTRKRYSVGLADSAACGIVAR